MNSHNQYDTQSLLPNWKKNNEGECGLIDPNTSNAQA